MNGFFAAHQVFYELANAAFVVEDVAEVVPFVVDLNLNAGV